MQLTLYMEIVIMELEAADGEPSNCRQIRHQLMTISDGHG